MPADTCGLADLGVGGSMDDRIKSGHDSGGGNRGRCRGGRGRARRFGQGLRDRGPALGVGEEELQGVTVADRGEDVDRDRQPGLGAEVGLGGVAGHGGKDQDVALARAQGQLLGVGEGQLGEDAVAAVLLAEQLGGELVGRVVVNEDDAAGVRRLLQVVDQGDVGLAVAVRADLLPATRDGRPGAGVIEAQLAGVELQALQVGGEVLGKALEGGAEARVPVQEAVAVDVAGPGDALGLLQLAARG